MCLSCYLRVTFCSSDSSPVEVIPAHFSREGLGRQSMSEKRKGHLDPRVTAFYQQVKMARGKCSDCNIFFNFMLHTKIISVL